MGLMGAVGGEIKYLSLLPLGELILALRLPLLPPLLKKNSKVRCGKKKNSKRYGKTPNVKVRCGKNGLWHMGEMGVE